MRKAYRYLKETYSIAGVPGWLLLGYNVVITVLARTKSDAASIDFTAIIFAGYAMLSGIYCFMTVLKDPESHAFFSFLVYKSPLRFFCLYTLWCLVSAYWSTNAVLTAYRAMECFGLLLVIIATIDRLTRVTNIEGVVLWSVVYAFLTVTFDFVSAWIKLNLDYGLYHAQFTATIFFYLALFFSPKKWIKYPMMAIALLCKSATGYMGMAIGLVSLLFGNRKYKLYGVILGSAICISFLQFGVDKVLNNTVFVTKKEVMKNGKIDMTKTSGRDKIWETAISNIDREGKTMIGYGFVAGETYYTYRFIGRNVIGVHNGFLSAYIGTGVPGFILFTLFMVGSFWTAFYRGYQKKMRSLLIASMCLVFIHTLGNPGLGFRVYGTWMPAMYIIVLTLGIKYSIQNQSYNNNEDENNMGY